MKKIILLALTALTMVGCGKRESESVKTDNGYKIIIVDSCEYIETRVVGYSHGTFLLHKNNCHFCQERRQKEFEELITKLKEK